MRGMVFTEFLDFVEEATSPAFVEDMLDAVETSTGGAYSAVGNYDHGDILNMVGYISEKTGQPVPALVHAFGRSLFDRFVRLYPDFFTDQTRALDFLQNIESHIHTEVRKLYPDSRPPVFDVSRPDAGELVMHYQSDRPFADLCAGLIEGALAHFGDTATVERDDRSAAGNDAVFTIRMS